MNALVESLNTRKAFISTVRNQAIEMKASGITLDIGGEGTLSSLNEWQSRSKYSQRYALCRGIVYSAVNALASEGASQPIEVKQHTKKKKLRGTKAAKDELEVLTEHVLIDCFERPNPIQNKWQFLYSFIANLALTGWAYIIGEVDEEDKPVFYSIPTTWITPDHTKGPFESFKLQNPHKPGSASEMLDKRNVGFAYLPDPSDIMGALSPASTQLPAIQSNDNIWQSRLQFFKNGIFPGSLVTVGSNPHPGVPAGIRPRLTGVQRQQVYSMVKKLMSGIANYGDPAILDGLIEKIEPLSMNSKEMGWEKSEPATKAAILSAFCVHPYILGEAVSVGGYAQVANIEKRFYKRVNTYLSMFDTLMTWFVQDLLEDTSLKVCVKECNASDPTLDWANWKYARSNGDITQNELREKLGLPPDEDDNQSAIAPQLLTPIVQLLAQKASGAITVEQIENILVGLGLPTDLAKKVAGKDMPPQQPVEGMEKPGKSPEEKPTETELLKEAVNQFKSLPDKEMGRLKSLLEIIA